MYEIESCNLLKIAASVSRQDESNPLIFLAPRVGKMGWSCVLGISNCVPLEKILFCLEITSLPCYYYLLLKRFNKLIQCCFLLYGPKNLNFAFAIAYIKRILQQ